MDSIQEAIIAAVNSNNDDCFLYLTRQTILNSWDPNAVWLYISEDTSTRIKQEIQLHEGLSDINRTIMNTDGHFGEISDDDDDDDDLESLNEN